MALPNYAPNQVIARIRKLSRYGVRGQERESVLRPTTLSRTGLAALNNLGGCDDPTCMKALSNYLFEKPAAIDSMNYVESIFRTVVGRREILRSGQPLADPGSPTLQRCCRI